MQNCNATATPGPTTNLETEDDSETKAPYREAIGTLLFLASVTRPDISYATNQLSRYMENPKQLHWEGVKRVFRYLNGTINHGLQFGKNSVQDKLMCYSDADFAGDVKTRKSTSGFVLTFGGTAVDWFSRRQSIVALSTAESEYVAAANAVKEMVYMQNLAKELEICDEPIILKVDNQSAIRMIEDETAHKKNQTHRRKVSFY